MDSDSSPNRIRVLRQQRGLTLEQLAALTPHPRTAEPVDLSTISKLEKGKRRLTADWMERIASALGVEPAELLSGSSSYTPVRRVPLVGRIPAGNWREAIEDPLALVPCEVGGPHTFALVVEGDSMNRIVEPGGRIFVDPDDADLVDGHLYAVLFEGETTFKRYQSGPPRLSPESNNPDHRDILVGRQPFTVIGRVVGAMRVF